MIRPAWLGMRAKTGRAVAVILGGPIRSPEVFLREDLILVDPKRPETKQPYHAVMQLPWPEAMEAAKASSALVQQAAVAAVKGLIGEARAKGFGVRGVGVVGSTDRDLARIGNYHIRAHAAEGILFRRVLEAAAEASGLRWLSSPEKDLFARARSEMSRPEADLKRIVTELGQGVIRPWRADEKAAAMAAWLAQSAFEAG
jgi:hypothetical protein